MSYLRLTIIVLSMTGLALLTAACAGPVVAAGGYAADGGLLATSNKTSVDHLVSMASKQDCALWRSLRGREICKPREGDTDPYAVNYSEPQRTVAEDGVHYGPPLRPAADAPATSWDAAPYKQTAPPVPPPPIVPVTAVADAPERPVQAGAQSATPKPKKPKVRSSSRKPSPGPAASGS